MIRYLVNLQVIISIACSYPNNIERKKCMETSTNHKKCLPKLVEDDSLVIILGTLPGDESIRAREYYANKKNKFWQIVYGTFYETYNADILYSAKKDFLKQHHIALWDIISEADRIGSADKNIKNPVLNDLDKLFAEHPLLRNVIINGKGLQKERKKQYRSIAKILPVIFKKYNVRYVYLPSTAWRFMKEEDISKWQKTLRAFCDEQA